MVVPAKAREARPQLFLLLDAKVTRAFNRALPFKELVGKDEYSRNCLSLLLMSIAVLVGRVKREG